MAKEAGLFATISACVLIILLLVVTVLAISVHEKQNQCKNNPNFWCWREWNCDPLGVTGATAGSPGVTVIDAFAVYKQFFNSCTEGTDGTTCPCAFNEPTGAGAQLCNYTGKANS